VEQLINNYHEAFNRKDIESVMSMFAEDAELTFVGAGTYKGKTEVRRFFEDTLWKQFPTIKVSVNLKLVEENHVACEGELNGLASTGKEFNRIGFAEIFKIVSGKIARLTVYYDTPSMRAQVGKW